MPILTIDEVQNFLEITSPDQFGIIDTIHTSVEQVIPKYCNRIFDAADYREFYSGKGSQKLLLNNFPIVDINYLSMSRLAVIRVYNTNKYTNAFVSVDSSGINLKYNGLLSAVDLSFTSNTTITAMVAAINSAGNGWVASVLGDYGDIITSELLISPYKSAINSTYINLEIPWSYINDYECDYAKGIIYLPTIDEPYNNPTENPLFRENYSAFVERNNGDFYAGFNNIFVSYRAGYEDDDMPDDLKFAALVMCKELYDRTEESSYGLKNYSLQFVISKNYLDEAINVQSKTVLDKYKKINL